MNKVITTTYQPLLYNNNKSTKEASFAEKYPLPASPTCQLFGYNLSCLKHRRTKKNSWNCHVIVRAMGELMYCTAAVWQDFPRKFPRKVTVMYWRHLCEFKTLPTYILFLSVLWKKYFVFRSRRKMKKKIKSSQNKYQFLFFWTLLSWKKISTLSLSQAWITTTLSVSLIQETKTLKTTKTEENYSCEKIRKLDFDIILIIPTIHGFDALFGQKTVFLFSKTQLINTYIYQQITISRSDYFYHVLFFSMLKRDHIGVN